MIDKKRMSLLIRQLKDIISQANRILDGNSSSIEIENFAKYSNELKGLISKNISNEEILNLNKEIPHINYKRNRIKIWFILILPYWLIILYLDYYARKKSLDEIKTSRNKYASIEFLSHPLLNQMSS